MTRLQSAFSKPHPAFVAFITAGDGDTAANLGVTLHAHAGDAVAKKQGEAGVLPSEVAHKIGRLLAT